MVFANADYMGVAFDTIIKMYRERLGRKPSERIEDYATDFTKYLGSKLFSSDAQQAMNVLRTWQVVFDDLGDDIRVGIRRVLREKGECSSTRQKEIISEVTAMHLRRLEECQASHGFEKKNNRSIMRQYKRQYDSARQFTTLQPPNKNIENSWRQIAGLAITKIHGYPTTSGIVVTGFGESEVFPQYVVTRVSGIMAGTQKYLVDDKDGVAHDGGHAMIVPFAQIDMIQRFMNGVDRSYDDYVNGAMIDALIELAKAVIDVHVPGSAEDKAKTREEVTRSIFSQAKVLQKNAQNWRTDRFVNPILDAVVSLPKDELANLAEALVNLTCIKRRVSTERETVGGPVDVAVISKGDGFVWIKRKRYFRPELNLDVNAMNRNAFPQEHAYGS
jgi:hypothetical protein